jgi:hypothetical protein
MTMPKTDETVSPEAAVRLYLTFLEDPSKLVDTQEVKRLEGHIEKAKDPLDKLRAISALHRARAVDPASYAYGFVKHAKRWADEEGVPEAAFREMSVPEDVLRAAGYGKPARGARGRASTNGAVLKRTRLSADSLQDGILTLDGEFTIRDIANRVGGSPLTIKNQLGILETQGKIRPAGEKAGSRGRAAKAWAVAGR